MSLVARIARKGLSIARDMKLSTNTKVSHGVVVPHATYSPWYDDVEFLNTFRKIRANSLVDIYRAYELWSLVGETSDLEGDLIEVGVWRGGTGCLMALRTQQLQGAARVFLCDTFQGVVKAGNQDSRYRGGEHADTSVETVQRKANEMGLNNVELLQGIFPDATGDIIKDRQFKLCHIDVNVYDSARQVAEWVWPRLVPGGVMVYDDYGFASCEGVTNLVNERVQARSSITIHNLNGHAIVVKRG